MESGVFKDVFQSQTSREQHAFLSYSAKVLGDQNGIANQATAFPAAHVMNSWQPFSIPGIPYDPGTLG